MQVKRTKLSDIANMAHVTRWHAMNVSRAQSVAEHTTLVTMYAHRLLVRIYPNHTPAEALALLLDSLWHDAPEAVGGLGDMPTPVKRLMEAEYPDGESPLDRIEREYCPEHAQYRSAVEGTPLYAISKLADILEAQHFIMVEGKKPTGDKVFERRGEAFRDLVLSSNAKWPELNWKAAFEIQEELLYGEGTVIEYKEKFQK